MVARRSARGLAYAVGAELAQIADDSQDAATVRLLNRYLDGWAEANPRKIAAATAIDYCFDDPLVGRFSRWSISAYLERLQAKFERVGARVSRDLAIVIRGPVGGPLWHGPMQFFREAPRLGLSGITFITVGERGVAAETVAYDLNLATEVLRSPVLN
jgi:hypothetical protein